MQGFDLHMHTSFCDGRDSAEDMVRSAISMGLECIGFSAHSYTYFDESYCLSERGSELYRQEISRLKEKYGGKIRILCGIEQDVLSTASTDGYDYVIGSMHYLKNGDVFSPVDESAEQLNETIRRFYGGSFYAMAEDYYASLARLLPATGANIIGHLDLVAKFKERGLPFNENEPRYMSAYTAAVESLVKLGIPFEINTGAISRSYRSQPYPDIPILRCIREKGGRVVLSSDSHQCGTLCYEFSRWGECARAMGFEDVSLQDILQKQ